MKCFKMTCLVVVLLFAVSLSKGEVAVKQKAGEIKAAVTCKYLLYLPEGYGQKGKKWPLMMFLHGAGERGNNLDLLKVTGIPKMIEDGKKFDFIIVSPQCPQRQWWPGKAEVLIALLDEIESKYEVDKDRVYLTGLSMGGFGSWTLGCGYPERFAAIAPICGGCETWLVPQIKDVPLWVFHGAKDNVVPLARSQEVVDVVNAAGGNAKLTIYPEAGHDAWTQTYENPALYEWFLSHRISDRKK
ncbi:MAG: prolyl oligopeptidase family serine peptidase [Sedimentisphaerales bacterium]|nr:prolyl oligopeptidase family serine peptidase [Sedimentisphaerales bacterium]